RNASAELLELSRLAQEFDDLLQLFLGLFHTGDILECDLLLLRGMESRPALTEAQRLVTAALHLSHHEDPERQQQDERRCIDQERNPARAACFLDIDLDAFLLENFV